MTSENIDVRLLQAQYVAMRKELDDEKKRNGGPTDPPGGAQLEARVAKLETHVEYIRRDLDEMKVDLKEVHEDLSAIKRRMSYFGGAAFIVAVIFGWIVNNRFDQVLGLLTKAS